MYTPALVLRFPDARLARVMVVSFATIAAVAMSAAAEPTGAQAQAPAATQAAGVEFSGYMRSGSDHRFILTNPESLTASGWLAVGQAFDGFTVENYEAERETLSVRKAGKVYRLQLKDARVTHAAPVNAPPAVLPTRSLIVLGDGRLLISGETIASDGLAAHLQQIAAAEPGVPRFRLSVYLSTDGDRALVKKSQDAVLATTRTLPQDLRRRFPFVVIKSLPGR